MSQRSLLEEQTTFEKRSDSGCSEKGGRLVNSRVTFVPVGNKVLYIFTLCLSLFTRALRECESVCASDRWRAQHFGGSSGIDERIDERIIARIDARDQRADRRANRRAGTTSGSSCVCKRWRRHFVLLQRTLQMLRDLRRLSPLRGKAGVPRQGKDEPGRWRTFRRRPPNSPRGAARFEGGDDAPRG